MRMRSHWRALRHIKDEDWRKVAMDILGLDSAMHIAFAVCSTEALTPLTISGCFYSRQRSVSLL